MPIKADRTYSGEITGGGVHYASTGSLGIDIHIECNDGSISHTWWLTEKTKDRVEKNLTELGITKEQLSSETFLESIGEMLTGKAIEFTTISEPYRGEDVVRVQWVNPPRKTNGISPAKAAAALFGGRPMPAPVTTAATLPTLPRRNAPPPPDDFAPITDDDVPF